MQNAFCTKRRRFGTRFRETVMTNAVFSQNDAKRILGQNGRFCSRFIVIVMTKLV